MKHFYPTECVDTQDFAVIFKATKESKGVEVSFHSSLESAEAEAKRLNKDVKRD